MMKAPDTTLMPGTVFITWKAARSTLPVVFIAPAHLAVGVARLNHKAAEIEGLAVVRRASSMVMPLLLRSS